MLSRPWLLYQDKAGGRESSKYINQKENMRPKKLHKHTQTFLAYGSGVKIIVHICRGLPHRATELGCRQQDEMWTFGNPQHKEPRNLSVTPPPSPWKTAWRHTYPLRCCHRHPHHHPRGLGSAQCLPLLTVGWWRRTVAAAVVVHFSCCCGYHHLTVCHPQGPLWEKKQLT